MAPLRLKKQEEEYTKANRKINSLSRSTSGMKSSVEGGQAPKADPLQYCPVETAKIGVGVVHLPILESMGPTVEVWNNLTAERI